MKHTALLTSLAFAGGILAAGLLSYAGPLDPPLGPVAPSYKTLTDVEPRTAVNGTNTPGDADSVYKIVKAGSYYLSANVLGATGKCGIEIAASDVTLDLNGFEVLGVSGAGAVDGVMISGYDALNIKVCNGTISNWGDNGIETNYNGGHPPQQITISNVNVSGNTTSGMYLWGSSIVTDCIATENRSRGIDVLGSGTVARCTAKNNGDDGIAVNAAGTITACTATNNGGDGFSLALGSTMSECTGSFNANGASGQGGSILNCSFYSNDNSGIAGFEGLTVVNCNAYRNKLHGISVANGSTVADCTAHSNDSDGFRVTSGCLVRGNTASGNGANLDGAGIHATGTDNRIEGNLCRSADRGIDVDGAGNVIIRNTCAGNTTNWDIVANNVCGPVIDRTAPGSAAILGNSAPDSTGSTHANANFTY